MQGATAERFLYHDAWKHGFPMFVSVARHMGCGPLPTWIHRVDTGSPAVIQLISVGLTQIVRLPALWLTGCLDLDLPAAMAVYKAHLVLGHLLFSAGMLVLGRLLFRDPRSAAYLFVATLFSGMFLDSLHSSQVPSIVFWWPWIVAAAVLCHRTAAEPAGGWWFNVTALFASLAALDQYPHYVVLPFGLGTVLYAGLWRARAMAFLRANAVRLWPALVIVVVVGFQSWVVRDAILGYKPSLRGDLVVDPRHFGETAFVQPTAVIGTLLPMSFLAGFDHLGNALQRRLHEHIVLYPLRWIGAISRAFIFRLDVLLFAIGVIPTVLAAVFAFRRGAGRLRAWWLALAIGVLLVSLQQSGLYYVLFHLPFFNVFRIYFLYVVIGVFAVLVISGYGMDALLTTNPPDRGRALRRGLLLTVIATALAAGFIVWLLPDVRPRLVRRVLGFMAADVAVLAASGVALWKVARSTRPSRSFGLLLVVLVVAQLGELSVAYSALSVPARHVVAVFGLDDDDLAPAPDGAPPVFRKPCRTYAECYLSRRDTISLRHDEQGTFLRDRDSPVLRNDLEPAVIDALVGITHPVFWLSRRVEGAETIDAVAARLNRAGSSIGRQLDEVTYVATADAARLPRTTAAPTAAMAITDVRRTRDAVRVRYMTEAPAFFNAAVTYDPRWSAIVAGRAAPVVRGNVAGLVVPVSAGAGEIELRYVAPAHQAAFVLRYASLLAGLLCALLIVRYAVRNGCARDGAVPGAAPPS